MGDDKIQTRLLRSPGGGLGDRPVAAKLRRAQAAFYLVSGLWPVLHLRSFMKVTGPKKEEWLVRSVGLLTASIGLVLARPGNEAGVRHYALLGGLPAASLALIDFTYSAKGRLRPVYLLDGAVQSLLAASWLYLWRSTSLVLLDETSSG